MKVFIDKENSDYVEIKEDEKGNVNFSIRTKKNDNTNIIITAKLNEDILDKIIANLILLKSRNANEKK